MIQLAVANDTVLAMVTDTGETSSFQRLSDWLLHEKGEINDLTQCVYFIFCVNLCIQV